MSERLLLFRYIDIQGQLQGKTIDEAIVELQPGDVVVTHHLPCFASIHQTYQKAPTNCFFYGSMEDIIEEKKPALWVHGHTHEPSDYVYGETRIVCNPHGYPGERRCSPVPFHSKYIVEV